MTAHDILDEAARLAAATLPEEPVAPSLAALILPHVLDQRTRLARALLAAHPAYVQPHHHRAPTAEADRGRPALSGLW